MTRKQRIARAFGAAADSYAQGAVIQRLLADRLAARIGALPLPVRPKVLEIGCGSGFLTGALARHLPGSDFTITDLAPAMVEACQAATDLDATYRVMDGEHPDLAAGGFDLICAGLTVQWFDDLEAGLSRLCQLLRPGGRLVFSTLLSGTFAEWRAAHAAAGETPGLLDFVSAERLGAFSFEGARLILEREQVVERHNSATAFVRSLKAIGAQTAARAPLSPPALKRVMQRFESGGAVATYDVGYGMLKRRDLTRGVFVTGSDTDVGKTVASAILVRALDADYWKPVQTGIAVDPGDTATVARLADLSHERLHAPAYAFAEPLSPHAAAALEGAEVETARLVLPHSPRPIVVEGAGGVLVPLNVQTMMIELMQKLDLPVVVAVRSTLGTINHSLLTLEALRARGLDVLGIVMIGPPSRSNREAVERFGQVPVLAEIPHTDDLSPTWIAARAADLRPHLEADG